MPFSSRGILLFWGLIWALGAESCHSPAQMTPFEAASGKPLQVESPVPNLDPSVHYGTPQDVVFSSSTQGAMITYTVDGTTPTPASPLFDTKVSLTKNITIKAQAFKSGFPDSPIFAADYKIGTPQPQVKITFVNQSSMTVTADYVSPIPIQKIELTYPNVASEWAELVYKGAGGGLEPDVTNSPGSQALSSGTPTVTLDPGLTGNLASYRIKAYAAYPSAAAPTWSNSLVTDITVSTNFPPTYRVYYQANGGTGTITDPAIYPAVTSDPNQYVTVASGTSMGRSDYDFAGWNTLPNGTGNAYTAGTKVNLGCDTTLFAQWKHITGGPVVVTPGVYTVTVNGPANLYFGTQATFTSTYSGNGGSTYLWLLNNVPLTNGTYVAGASSSTLVFTPKVTNIPFGSNVLTLIVTDSVNHIDYSASLNINAAN